MPFNSLSASSRTDPPIRPVDAPRPVIHPEAAHETREIGMRQRNAPVEAGQQFARLDLAHEGRAAAHRLHVEPDVEGARAAVQPRRERACAERPGP
jgi:hypothetical protein